MNNGTTSLKIGVDIVAKSPKFYLSQGFPRSSEFKRKQKKLEPSMETLDGLNLAEILLFTERRPGPRLTMEGSCPPENILNYSFTDIIGCETLDENSNAALAKRADNLQLDLSHIDALFLCSGPFRLMTTRLEDHMVLDQDVYPHVYWDFTWTFQTDYATYQATLRGIPKESQFRDLDRRTISSWSRLTRQ
jgi:hypothetical protein